MTYLIHRNKHRVLSKMRRQRDMFQLKEDKGSGEKINENRDKKSTR